MANRGASILLLLTIALKTTNILGNLVEGIAKPVQYITLPPSHYDEDPFDVIHNTGNCTPRVATVNEEEVEVLACPYGELLLNGVTQANLNDGVNVSDIRTFYTWQDRSLPMNVDEVFVTLQFPNSAFTPTKVVVYSLEMMDLDATEPRRINLYSSTTERMYPDEEIRDIDETSELTEGTTSGNDDYTYIRHTLTIREDSQVPLNYLRIEFDFDGSNWIFISEVEVYHLHEPLPSSTSVQTPTPSMTASPSSKSLSTMTSTSASSSVENKASMSSMPVMSTTSIAQASSTPTSTFQTPTGTFQTPAFIFPTVNPLVLHLKTTRLNVTINCTVAYDGDLSQLNTVWSYNGTMIRNSQKYSIIEGGLLIRQITPEDVGTYECTVKHPSGWNGSRQYYISIQDGNIVQQSAEGHGSSKDLPLPIIGAAAGSILLLLLLCLALTISVIVCHRKNKWEKHTRKKSYLVPEAEPAPILHTYVNENPLEQRKGSIDSRYDNMYITNTLSTETSIKEAPPTVPRFPKKFKYSKKIPPPEVPKLQGDYAFLGNYKRLKTTTSVLVSDQTSETYFDIYDDTRKVSAAVKPPIPQLPQDIYCEAFDYNQHNKDDSDEEIYNGLSMCVSIYDNPKPLAQTEAPQLVEWSNVKMVAKIGEGQFGDVYLVEASGVNGVEQGTKSLAAIKTLKGDYSVYMKEQFEKEIKFMTRLDNANVVRLLGICNKGMPFIMMEYMGNGDLHMFLRKHYLPEIGKDTPEAIIQVDTVILQYVALQIANGMRYLATYGFIHRDLAARNCLVGEDYIVKIADFGMTQDLYNDSYFIMQGKAIVPIRWMAPECFFGKFSAKTDVWSYGVTLWEIFTLCRKQPYHEMTDEQLLIDVQKGRSRTLLKRPPFIPNEFYHVMANCWSYDSKKRPDFESVYDQLFDFYMQYNQQ